MKHNYLFTSESVSEGHPDKVADQISDAIVDNFLAVDNNAKVACETLVTTGQIILAGEVRSEKYVDIQQIAREVVKRIGYDKSDYKFDGDSCGILCAIHEQSEDIFRGVNRGDADEQGAGDQGLMFGYACNETPHFMPITLDLAHEFMKELAAIRKEGHQMNYLRPDAKSQMTVEYDGTSKKPIRIHTIVISTQHDEFIKPANATEEAKKIADEDMLRQIHDDVQNILIPRVIAKLPEDEQKLFDNGYELLVNPTGKFVIGGPYGDTGLTGRKIIVDTYGGRGAHGGGAFSGKDPSKVDRSAAYMARYLAKNLVAAGVADEILVQIAYAIGVAEPVSVHVNTYGSSNVKESDVEIAQIIATAFDLRPNNICKTLKLRNPIYEETAAYGHFGRDYEIKQKIFNGEERQVELFTWERLDLVQIFKEMFSI